MVFVLLSSIHNNSCCPSFEIPGQPRLEQRTDTRAAAVPAPNCRLCVTSACCSQDTVLMGPNLCQAAHTAGFRVGSEACPYHVCHPNMVRVLHRFFSAGCKVCARTHAGRRSLLTVPHAVPQGLRTLLQAACSVRRRLGLCTVCGCGTCPRVAWMVPSPSWELQSEPSSSKAALPASGPARHAP